MTPAGLQHPGRWWWLLLVVPAVLGLMRLRLNVDVFDLLPGNNPTVRGLRAYQEHFSNARELILTLRGPQADSTEQYAGEIAARLRAATNLVQSVTWKEPWLEHPGESAELIAFAWLNQPPEIFAGLAERLKPESAGECLRTAKEQLATSFSPGEIARLGYDPFGLTRLPEAESGALPFSGEGTLFASPDGRFRILFVKAPTELRTYKECGAWLKEIKRIVERPAAPITTMGRPEVGYTGRPVFASEIAAEMQRDMQWSVVGTALIIGLLFWIAHRRLRPLLWLLVLLGVVLACTLGIGGLIFGSINVVSMGFAAILLGLAVDYGVVHFQEALAHPQLSIPQIRRGIAPSIFWAAFTTIAAFISLNWGGLPGLAQLGTLVAAGVLLAALIMVFEYLPPLFPNRRTAGVASQEQEDPSPAHGHRLKRKMEPSEVVTVLLFIGLAAALWRGLPQVDSTANALRPRKSVAYSTLTEVQRHLGQGRESSWIVVSGSSEAEVAEKLELSRVGLQSAQSNGWVSDFTLPTSLWPNPAFQATNLEAAQRLVSLQPSLTAMALENGFTDAALGLMDGVFTVWRNARSTPGVYWPGNSLSQWVLGNVAARSADGFYALGLVHLNQETNGPVGQLAARIGRTLPEHGVWLSGWELLGHSIFAEVSGNFPRVLGPMAVLILISLVLAFRRWEECLLSILVLLASGACLLAVMRMFGWRWNLLNLMGIPLVLGTGIDYSIFVQMALRRFRGDRKKVHRSVGRALLLCGGTAIGGFGMLAFSSNAGMASLGQVCAAGIACNMLLAVFLLPDWWTRLTRGKG